MLEICKNCPLYESSLPQYVPPTIPPMHKYNLNRAMLIGEAPGANEVEERKGFVGASGTELDMYLYRAYIPRDSLIITNIIRCRPPGNRDPKKDEIQCCTQHLDYLLKEYKKFI